VDISELYALGRARSLDGALRESNSALGRPPPSSTKKIARWKVGRPMRKRPGGATREYNGESVVLPHQLSQAHIGLRGAFHARIGAHFLHAFG
jgi:hypothetical protein